MIDTTEKGSLKALQQLKQQGGDIHCRDRAGGTLLHLAAADGHAEIAAWLIENGVDINIKNKDRDTALCMAARHDNEDIVALLLDNNPDFNTDERKYTALHYAVGRSHYGIASRLLKAGIDANATNYSGDTPLHFIGRGLKKDKTLQIVQTLLAHGARVDAVNKSGETPLHQAAECGRADWVALLLEHNAPVKTTDNDGNTPLHCAVAMKKTEAALLLLEAGGDMRAPNKRQETPLTLAVSKNDTAVAAAMFKRGADVMTADNSGYTLLHRAAYHGNHEMCALLLEKGAEVNAKNDRGLTPLAFCLAHRKDLDTARVLLQAGADPETQLDCGLHKTRTALQYSASWGNHSIVKLLLQAGADPNRAGENQRAPLEQCLLNDPTDNRIIVLKHLLQAGATFTEQAHKLLTDEFGPDPSTMMKRPEHRVQRKKLLAAIVSEGVPLHGQRPDNDNKTLLHVLCGNATVGNKELRLVLDAAATSDINAKDCHGDTPLHCYLKRTSASSISASGLQLLLDAGADVNAVNDKGVSAIDIVAQKHMVAVREQLLENGADPAQPSHEAAVGAGLQPTLN